MPPLFPPPDEFTQAGLRITVIRHLMDGGFKSVYECVMVGDDSGTPAVVTVEDDSNQRERLALEQLASRPYHPNIVRVIARHEVGGRIFTVFERLHVELFDRVIDGGAMAEPTARGFFVQCVLALRHMHRCGVAHRDIKLENIMLSRDGTLKFLDFNLSTITPTLPPPGDIFGDRRVASNTGSRSYRAPEVATPTAMYDPYAADVWSLGVVLFTMATGFFFVDQATAQDPRFRVVQQAQEAGHSTVGAIFQMYHLPNPLSGPLTQLLDGMLTIDPAQRLTLDQVAAAPAGSWLSTAREQMMTYDAVAGRWWDVMPLAPSLWRVRAQLWWGRVRRPALHAGRLAQVLRVMYAISVERTLRPGGTGALAAQRHFEELAPEYDRTSARYRSLGSSDMEVEDGHAAHHVGALEDDDDGEQPVYRNASGRVMDTKDALVALVAEVLREAQLDRLEPPQLQRQRADGPSAEVAGEGARPEFKSRPSTGSFPGAMCP